MFAHARVFLDMRVWVNIQALGRLPFAGILFSLLSPAEAVCLSCAGNDPNCPGDSTCVLGLALKANAALMAGTVVAGAATVITMGSGGKYILPLSWLQFLKPSVLQTLLNLQNRAPVGTPVEIEKLTVADLVRKMREGTVSDGDARMDLMRRLTETNLSTDERDMIKMVCEIMPRRDSSGTVSQSPMARAGVSGALQFVFAISMQIVRRLTDPSKLTVVLNEGASSASAATVSVELKRPKSNDEFQYGLTVWQAILTATGLANAVTTGMFLAEIVHDVIISTSNWKVALEHFLLYVQKIDSGCGWELANASAKGSHDSFMNKALKAAGVVSPLRPPPQSNPKNKSQGNPPSDPDPPNSVPKKWNGEFNKDPGARPCAAFNSGQEHRPQNLTAAGACKFCHKCDQWVSNKGPGGRCESTSHSRSACNNSHKCENRVE